MNVLFLTLAYPPNSLGGTEMSTHAVARGLCRQGHLVHVICADRWGEGPEHWNGETQDVYEGVYVARLLINWKRAPDPCGYLYRNPWVAKYLHRWLLEQKPDIVHATSCITLSADVLNVVSELGIPLVLTLTDFWTICPRIKLIRPDGRLCDGHVSSWECLNCMLWDAKLNRWPRRLLPGPLISKGLRWIAKYPFITRHRGLRGMAFDIDERREFVRNAVARCDLIIVKSNYTRMVFESHDFPAGKMVVLEDGEDTSWGAEIPTINESGTLRIGYLGHIIPPKGIDVLVKAFRGVTGPAELHIFGDLSHDLPYTALLRDLAGDDQRIQFHGGIPHESITQVFSQIDILVVPSIWPETFCHVVREGFIAKVPVIASNIGALPEAMIHGQNGYLFPAGDIRILRERLQSLVDCPESLRKLRSNIPAIKTVQRQVEELTRLYQSLLK